VAEVGSGAGSIAWLDAGGLLHVGPISAGAEPGPACYRRGGTRPTVTDANVALGLLPTELAGGALSLDREAARDAIERDIARPLGIDVDTAACGIREMVNANMTRAIRAVTVERGVDPRDYTLLAFGGSGPLHGCDLAASLGIPRVVFPRLPGVFTAMGMLTGDIERFFIRPCAGRLAAFDATHAATLIAEMKHEALEGMAEEGYPAEQIELSVTLDLRFLGQDSAIAVPLPESMGGDIHADLRQDFLDRYRRLYHYASTDAVESTSLRLIARGIRRSKLDFAKLGLLPAKSATVRGSRKARFGRDDPWREVPVIARDALSGAMHGPLLIESEDSAVVIPPHVSVAPDAQGNLTATLPALQPARSLVDA
jgi:N-methylhydantoinase A